MTPNIESPPVSPVTYIHSSSSNSKPSREENGSHHKQMAMKDSRSADEEADSNSLESFLSDIVAGKTSDDIRAPGTRLSMINLSQEALIPAPVNSRRTSREKDPPTAPSTSEQPAHLSNDADLDHGIPANSPVSLDVLTPKALVITRGADRKPDKVRTELPRQTFLFDDSSTDSQSSSSISPSTLAGEINNEGVQSRNEFPRVASDFGERPIVEGARSSMVRDSQDLGDARTRNQRGSLLLKEKAAKLLGIAEGSQVPSPVSATTPVLATLRSARESTFGERHISPPGFLRNMASKMSLIAPKSSPRSPENSPIVHSPGGTPIDAKGRDFLLRKKRGPAPEKPSLEVLSRQSSGGKSSGGMPEMEQGGIDSPTMFRSMSSTTTSSISISKRRGFRPLSVHTGQAFDMSTLQESLAPIAFPVLVERPESHDGVEEPEEFLTIAAKPKCPRTGNDKIFNSNYIAMTLSKTPPDLADHPAHRKDPFSPRPGRPASEIVLTPSQVGTASPRTFTSSTSPPQTSSHSSVCNTHMSTKLPNGKPSVDVQVRRNLGDLVARDLLGLRRASSTSVPAHRPDSVMFSWPSVVTEESAESNNCATVARTPRLSLRNAIRKSSTPSPLPPTPTRSRSRIIRSTTITISPARVEPSTPAGYFSEDSIGLKRSRGLSSWFRNRSGSKHSVMDKPTAEEISSEIKTKEDAEADRQVGIAWLRRHLNAQSQDYEVDGIYPRHPNTGRGWKHRNLRCTNCMDTSCACCKRACCRYKAAVSAVESPFSPAHVKEEALDIVEGITEVFPTGEGAPTFIQCTVGGGCGKMVCPDCCGVCPEPLCQDTQCRKCKKDPWATCDWHITGKTKPKAKDVSMTDANKDGE